MKLLHTSDLHLGSQWRRVSRAADHERVLDEVLALCDEHAVDALLVTGDIFTDRPEAPHEVLVRGLLDRLASHLRRGRAVILLRGNHDPLDLFRLMRVFVGEMAGGDRWPLVIADVPDVFPVPGLALQVVALPYVSPQWLRRSSDDVAASPEEVAAGLSGVLARALDGLARKVEGGKASIFAGHVLVTGAQYNKDVDAEPGFTELWLQPARLPQYTSYNAIGHIHLGQEVAGTGKPTWYSGAPDRHDLGERARRPQVLLVTVPDHAGGAATVEPIELHTCTPFVREIASGAEAVAALCVAWTGCDPVGEIVISDVEVSQRVLLEARVRQAAPRVETRWAVDRTALPPVVAGLDHHDMPSTVRAYLRELHTGLSDARRERLLDAFEQLLREPEEATL